MGAQPAEAHIGRLLAPHAGLTAGRSLSAAERHLAAEIFGDALDLDAVRVTRDSLLAVVSATSVCNRVNLRSDHGHFDGDGLHLARGIEGTLVHELVHCWQWQQGGVAYMPESLLAQGMGILRGRGRCYAYDWRRAASERRPWHRWNPEQQAQCIEDWWQASRAGFRITEEQRRAIAAVRQGRGAPRHSVIGALCGALVGAPLGATLGVFWGPSVAALSALALAVACGLALSVARPLRRR